MRKPFDLREKEDEMSSQDKIPTVRMVAPNSSQIYERVLQKLDTISTSQSAMRNDMTELAARVTELDERVSRASYRVTAESKTNADQDAALAAVIQKVDALAASQSKQSAMLEKLVAVTANPFVKDVARVLTTAFLTWAAAKGLR